MGPPALDRERTSLDRPTRMTDKVHLYGETGTSVGGRSLPTGSIEQPHVPARREVNLKDQGGDGSPARVVALMELKRRRAPFMGSRPQSTHPVASSIRCMLSRLAASRMRTPSRAPAFGLTRPHTSIPLTRKNTSVSM